MTTGIENNEKPETGRNLEESAHVVTIKDSHQRLIEVILQDRTDQFNQLVFTREWLLHRKDANLSLRGNLFIVECTLTGSGSIFVKNAPLPHVRQYDSEISDIEVRSGEAGSIEYVLHQTGPEDLESWKILHYEGGPAGCTRALHEWQQSLRPDTEEHRTPRFLSNTWGDRNRDACINHDFMLKEIDAGARLGVEIIQIDDGWQKGRSANSAEANKKNGVWSGFWDSDPEFWEPDPVRFHDGLDPLIKYAAEKGVKLGLWYAPDSHEDCANWQKDAEQILRLHRDYQVDHFKLDSIVAKTLTARRNLHSMIGMIEEKSNGKIVCDLDITANIRPGYFGEPTVGPLFLENRYTDWHSYWPHFTLRNLWQLSHYIDPRRLRMELLNNTRNTHKYENDPLAPGFYPPATLFAITMFANPLGWFENSGLPDDFVSEIASLVKVWKESRTEIFTGDIIPIGNAPDGQAWTGFMSTQKDGSSCHILIFNELKAEQKKVFNLPHKYSKLELLSGEGTVELAKNLVTAEIPKPFGYLFLKLKK